MHSHRELLSDRNLRGKAIDIRTASRIGRSGDVTGVQYSEHIRLRFVTTIRNSRPYLSCNYDNREKGQSSRFVVSMATKKQEHEAEYLSNYDNRETGNDTEYSVSMTTKT